MFKKLKFWHILVFWQNFNHSDPKLSLRLLTIMIHFVDFLRLKVVKKFISGWIFTSSQFLKWKNAYGELNNYTGWNSNYWLWFIEFDLLAWKNIQPKACVKLIWCDFTVIHQCIITKMCQGIFPAEFTFEKAHTGALTSIWSDLLFWYKLTSQWVGGVKPLAIANLASTRTIELDTAGRVSKQCLMETRHE